MPRKVAPKTFGVNRRQAAEDSHVFHDLDNGWRAGEDARREMSARQQNERKFGNWQELPGGGMR